MWMKLRDSSSAREYFYNSETQERRETRPQDGFRLYHILLKHRGSRNPVDVSFEDARERITAIYRNLQSRIDEDGFKDIFKDAACRHSQCSSVKRGGDLGFVCGNEMLKEFEQPAFMLKRGQIVGPVSTPSGLHIIYRR